MTLSSTPSGKMGHLDQTIGFFKEQLHPMKTNISRLLPVRGCVNIWCCRTNLWILDFMHVVKHLTAILTVHKHVDDICHVCILFLLQALPFVILVVSKICAWIVSISLDG